MTRYVGTGRGEWRGDSFKYWPSADDRLLAHDVGEATAERVREARRRAAARRDRTGYGDPKEVKGIWYATGFLGEVAALYPIGSGPDLAQWEGEHWYGSSDFGRLEVRTTSQWQLYGFAKAGKDGVGLGGWRVTRKDAGRAIVCVEERDDNLMVFGWVEADDVPRLRVPIDGVVLAVIEPPDLRPLVELDVYAEAWS